MIQLGGQFVDMQFESDGPVWRIHAEIIAANRASTLKADCDYLQVFGDTMRDTVVLLDWLLRDMPWDTICRNMTVVDPVKPLVKPATIQAKLTRVASGDAI